MRSIADFQRAAVTGSRWLCINRLHPHVSGLRTITGGTSPITYTGVHLDRTTFTDGRLDVPKAADVRIEDDSLHMLYEPGSDRVIWTWTLLPPSARDAALRPPCLFAACPTRPELRGPADTPWCVYDADHDKAVDADGQPVTSGAVYFATQAQAEALAEHLHPRGAQFDGWGVAPPSGDWAYEIDDSGIVYGGGPWPFHHGGTAEPRSVKLSPTTQYYAWRNEHVLLWPRRFGRADTTLSLYVRPRGSGAITLRCPVRFDLLANTFTVDGSCPPGFLEQASSKAEKILDAIDFARQERDTYLRPRTAHERYAAEQAAKAGEVWPYERGRREQPLPRPTGVPADVMVVHQAGDVWQRVGPDEWLTADVGDTRRPVLHRYDTAGMLRFGAVQALVSPPLPELERLGAALVGRKITVPPGLGGHRSWDLTVRHAQHGFLYGTSNRGRYQVLHLIESGLYDNIPPRALVDRTGRAITAGDQVHEYTNGRIGPTPAGHLVGTFRVVAVDETAGVLFTDRYAEHAQPQAVAFPDDVEVVPASVVSPSEVTVPLVRITKTEARRRWDADEPVAVGHERFPDGQTGFAMRPSRVRTQFATFDALVEASVNSGRPTAHFAKPAPIVDLVMAANAVRRTVSGDVWMRSAADEWLTISAAGDGQPDRRTVTTAGLLRLSDVEVLHTPDTAATCQQATAALLGHTVLVHAHRIGAVQMRVLDNTAGFLTGIAQDSEPITVHLLDTITTQVTGPRDEPDPWGPVLDVLLPCQS